MCEILGLLPNSLFGRLGYSDATKNLTPSQTTDNTRRKGMMVSLLVPNDRLLLSRNRNLKPSYQNSGK